MLCLSPQTQLETLDLSENGGCVPAIAVALENHNTMTALNLNYNKLDRNTVNALASALEHNKVLMTLQLEGTGIDPAVLSLCVCVLTCGMSSPLALALAHDHFHIRCAHGHVTRTHARTDDVGCCRVLPRYQTRCRKTTPSRTSH